MSRDSAQRARDQLVDGLHRLGLDASLAEPLLAYLHELQRWNKAYNLTSVRDLGEMVTRHLLDSLVIIHALDALSSPEPRAPGPAVVDVGAGAGLPGIPLAIARPQARVTLLDSNGKKVRFMRHAIRTLGLDNAEAHQARAEAFAPAAPFDVVTSRAFAALGDFLRWTDHLGAAHGVWLAMKGKLAGPEIAQLPEGFQVISADALHVPGLQEDRHLVVVRRVSGPAASPNRSEQP